MGIVAARHVMLDTEEDKKKGTTQLGLNALEVSWSLCFHPSAEEPVVALPGGLCFPGSAPDQV